MYCLKRSVPDYSSNLVFHLQARQSTFASAENTFCTFSSPGYIRNPFVSCLEGCFIKAKFCQSTEELLNENRKNRCKWLKTENIKYSLDESYKMRLLHHMFFYSVVNDSLKCSVKVFWKKKNWINHFKKNVPLLWQCVLLSWKKKESLDIWLLVAFCLDVWKPKAMWIKTRPWGQLYSLPFGVRDHVN